MKRKIQEWFNKRVQFAQWIHQNKKMRVKFRWIYIGFIGINALIFLGSVVLFYFYGLRFNSEDPTPYTNGTNIHFLVLGIVVFVIGFISTVLILGIYFPLLFIKSRELYMKTYQYKQQVDKYSEIDLVKFTYRELKWLKKLGWINKIQYLQTLTSKEKREN